jgi:hypothetical protein
MPHVVRLDLDVCSEFTGLQQCLDIPSGRPSIHARYLKPLVKLEGGRIRPLMQALAYARQDLTHPIVMMATPSTQ